MSSVEIHVERTGDPAVLRWVCHRVDLGSPGLRHPCRTDSTALAALRHRNEIVGIRTIDGDLLMTAPHPSAWPSLAPLVHDALVAELTNSASLAVWLTKAPAADDVVVPGAGVMATPTVSDVQAVVDDAAGAVASSHGGRIEVTAVDEDRVWIVMHGACHGCSGANTTLNDLVRRAVTGRWPHLTTSADEPASRPTFVPVLLARRGAKAPT